MTNEPERCFTTTARQLIYHLTISSAWQGAAADEYRPGSLKVEGFVHCSHAHQLAWVANQFFADQSDLLVLTLDIDRLDSPVREEEVAPGQRFPHVYGPINKEAVIDVCPLRRDAEGRWVIDTPTT